LKKTVDAAGIVVMSVTGCFEERCLLFGAVSGCCVDALAVVRSKPAAVCCQVLTREAEKAKRENVEGEIAKAIQLPRYHLSGLPRHAPEDDDLGISWRCTCCFTGTPPPIRPLHLPPG
jgi:hypothetical protein